MQHNKEGNVRKLLSNIRLMLLYGESAMNSDFWETFSHRTISTLKPRHFSIFPYNSTDPTGGPQKHRGKATRARICCCISIVKIQLNSEPDYHRHCGSLLLWYNYCESKYHQKGAEGIDLLIHFASAIWLQFSFNSMLLRKVITSLVKQLYADFHKLLPFLQCSI